MPSRFPSPGDALRLAALLVILLWIPVLTGLRFEPKRDEAAYHLPLAQELARRAPTMEDFRHSPVEMGPLFHAVLGGLGRLSGAEAPRLRAWMTAAGLASVALFALLAGSAGRADALDSALLLAAFPYFGACYFTAMTDYGAFLPIVPAWIAMLRWTRTRSAGALWAASVASLVACLVRQNLIFAPFVFLVWVVARGRTADDAGARGTRPGELAALAVPFLAIAVRLWLWRGIIPPEVTREDGFLGLDSAYEIPGGYPSYYGLAVTSMAANMGYYLLPATLALAVASGWSRRRLAALGGAAAAIALAMRLVRGPELVTTYGTFLHVVTALRLRFGEGTGLLVVAASLASFLVVAAAGWERARSPGPDREAMRLAAALLAGGLLILAFGKFRVFERYVLPLDALAILIVSDAASGSGRRLARAGLWGAVLFGFAHEVLYAWEVYDLAAVLPHPGR